MALFCFVNQMVPYMIHNQLEMDMFNLTQLL